MCVVFLVIMAKKIKNLENEKSVSSTSDTLDVIVQAPVPLEQVECSVNILQESAPAQSEITEDITEPLKNDEEILSSDSPSVAVLETEKISNESDESLKQKRRRRLLGYI